MPILPINANFGGQSFMELSQEWWQWAMPFPVQDLPAGIGNPFEDATGDFAYLGAGQGRNGNVFFLAGFAGNDEDPSDAVFFQASRQFEVPANQLLFLPVANWTSDYDLKTSQERADQVTEAKAWLIELSAEIDGRSVTGLKPGSDAYFVRTGDFVLDAVDAGTVGEALFGRDPDDGAATVQAGGYYLPIRGLGVGRHEIHIRAAFDFDADSDSDFGFDITNEITVVPPSQYHPGSHTQTADLILL